MKTFNAENKEILEKLSIKNYYFFLLLGPKSGDIFSFIINIRVCITANQIM